MKAIIRTIIAIAILAWILPTVDYLNWTTLLIAGVVLTILQSVIKPILKLFFLPVNIVTFGLFSLVINVIIIWLLTFLVPGMRIDNIVLFGVPLNSFFSLLLVSSLISFLQSFIRFFIK
ncbi:MAG: phage holin family protein [Patescibacteria group bacterium]